MTISYVGTSGSEEADVLSYIVPMHCPTSDQGCVAHKEKVSILATSVLPTAAGRGVRASQSILPVHHVYTIHTDPSTAIPQTVAQCCVQSHDHNNTH